MVKKSIGMFTSPEEDDPEIAVDLDKILFIRTARFDIYRREVRGTLRWSGTWIYFKADQRVFVLDLFENVLGTWITGRSPDSDIVRNRLDKAIEERKDTNVD